MVLKYTNYGGMLRWLKTFLKKLSINLNLSSTTTQEIQLVNRRSGKVDSSIKCEDPKTLRGLDGDLGGVEHVQETLFIRVDMNAAIIGANVERRRAPRKDATGRGAQFD